MSGKMITLTAEDGGSFGAYLALPEGGSGPGLVLLQEIFGVNENMRNTADLFAEEGYVTIVPDLFWRMEPGVDLGYTEADFEKAMGFLERFDGDQGIEDAGVAIEALRAMPECTGKIGALGFCLGGALAYMTACRKPVDVAVSFYGVRIEEKLNETPKCPLLMHFAGADAYVTPEAVKQITDHFASNDTVSIHVYPEVNHGFYCRERTADYHRPSAMMAHSRTIAAFRQVMGPHYDLEGLWDQHLDFEFFTRDAGKTMTTMVAEPYVNHVPTMTGGTGAALLHRFYTHHFIGQMPQDTKMVPISRTIGADRVVDEMLFCFTHDEEIDWMLPGVKPTGKWVEIPLIAVVNFRGDKLYHEHIYWDQASVLVQIGLLDPKGLPVAGVETARKVADETLPSNTLMARWKESEGK